MAFEKVLSGYPSFDKAIDNIRMGDNVVFQVSRLKEFRFFVDAFVKQAKKDGRRLVYIRFAKHTALVSEDSAVRYTLQPADGFETFATQVHNIIESEGKGVFYVFDCLSELQVAWAADLMMGNFFCVTCPFLFKLDTVAYFPVMRGAHSFEALARIRETTQLFLDIGSDSKNIYLHPIKVWNRYSATMFLPHRAAFASFDFHALTSSADSSKYYTAIASFMNNENQYLDSWERYFLNARVIADGCDVDEDDDYRKENIKGTLMRMMMSKDRQIRSLLGKYFSVNDYFSIKDKMIGSGRIGGKACGMLLARKIVADEVKDLAERSEDHDSFYIGDHVFYTYLVHNGLWELHVAQKQTDGYFTLAEKISAGIRNGCFPENINAEFRRLLEYFGQAPIIVRSSSLLEDGFGNAFAGKYESVFCPNQGNIEQRLYNLQEAVKTVYASTVDESALEYRDKMGLKHTDEQMSVLVQRVSGSFNGKYFFPSASGVGYSYDIYGLHENIDPRKGMLRMVIGLGTRAVDRTGTDYPRIIHIDNPRHSYLGSIDEQVRFSQRTADVIDLTENRFDSVEISKLKDCTEPWYHALTMEHDEQAERLFRERGLSGEVFFGSCSGYADNKRFISDMERILSSLQAQYQSPVDIEFTVNSNSKDEYMICLLQCRPLKVYSGRSAVVIPFKQEQDVLFKTEKSSMGLPQLTKIDMVVSVDPKGYYEYPYNRKSELVRVLEDINHELKCSNKTAMLIVPGRIGTSSPELGIPVRFAGISNYSILVEVDDADSGYSPELSYGSHMFQDLVESEIFYTAIFKNNNAITNRRSALLQDRGNALSLPDKYSAVKHIVSLYDTSKTDLKLYYDIVSEEALCAF